MKKPIGAIVIYSIGVLFGVYLLISSICQHDRPISIILTAILLLIFAAQLYLTVKGARKQDDESSNNLQVIRVLVQVHRRDPYKQKHPPNARTGPFPGPVRALAVPRNSSDIQTIPTFFISLCGRTVRGMTSQRKYLKFNGLDLWQLGRLLSILS